MRKILVLLFSLTMGTAFFSQNVGVGTLAPTHTLHVVVDPSNPNQDPIKIEGLKASLLNDTMLLVTDTTTGIVRSISFNDFVNTIQNSIDTDIDSMKFINDTLYLYEDNISLTTYIKSSLDTALVDSLILAQSDSLYSIINDSLLNDTTWLSELADSIDSDIDSAILINDTTMAIYENGKMVLVDLILLKDSAEWIDGSRVGLKPGAIYARKALQRGDTVIIDTNGNLGIGTNNPSLPFVISSSTTDRPAIMLENTSGTNNNNFLVFKGDTAQYSIYEFSNGKRLSVTSSLTPGSGEILGIWGNGEVTVSNGELHVKGIKSSTFVGNVGINPGSTAVTHELDVNGEARIRVINDTNDITGVLTHRADGVIQNIPYDTLLNSINDSINYWRLNGNKTGLESNPTRDGASGNIANGTYAIAAGLTDTASGNYSTVSGGRINKASGQSSTVGGGVSNIASSSAATVSGGSYNIASDWYATVSGGTLNAALGKRATVSGGANDTARGDYSTVSGGTTNIASGNYSSISGGQANSSEGNYAVVGGGFQNVASQIYSTISGGDTNIASGIASTVSGGVQNTSSGDYSVIAGGEDNVASGNYSTVSGLKDTASGTYSVVAGGNNNVASGPTATVSGGWLNKSIGWTTVVGGGRQNIAFGTFSVVSGGRNDSAVGHLSTVSGGYQNNTIGDNSVISGGGLNRAIGTSSSIGGGTENFTSGIASIVSGGVRNTSSGNYSVIAGGIQDSASGDYSVVGGGNVNKAIGFGTVVGGGSVNTALNTNSTVSGGLGNVASDNYSTVSGGQSNSSGGNYAVIGGGFNNATLAIGATVSGGNTDTALGDFSTVVGGIENTAYSYGELVGGIFASNYTPNSTTTWDANDRIFSIGNGQSSILRSNALTVLKNGNVGIGTTIPTQDLEVSGLGTITSHVVTLGNTNTDRAVFGLKRDTKLWDFGINSLQNGSNDLFFREGTNVRAVIQEGGNVGIGTTNPTKQLDVNGEARIRVINDTNNIAGVLTNRADGVIQNIPYDTLLSSINDSSEWIDGAKVGLTSGAIYARKALQRADTVVINNLGRVGIGTNSPRSILSNVSTSAPYYNIISGSFGQNTQSFIWNDSLTGYASAISNSGYGSGHNGLHIRIADSTSVSKVLTLGRGVSSVSNTNKDIMTVLGNGNVGIGATSPTSKLEVIENTDIVTTFARTDNVPGNQVGVDLGTNNPANRDKNAFIKAVEIAGINQWELAFGTSDYASTSIERMRIDVNGDVGIGTTVPNSKLQVEGPIATAITTTTTNLTLDNTHSTVIVTGGTPTIQISGPGGKNGRKYIIVNQTGGTISTVTNYIDFTGALVNTIPANSSITIQSDGSNWYRIQ